MLKKIQGFLFFLSLATVLSPVQGMQSDSSETAAAFSKVSKNSSETVVIECNGPTDNTNLFKKQIVSGVKSITLRHINFNTELMTHFVDALVATHQAMPASGLPGAPHSVNFLNFMSTPMKKSTVEHLIFERCTVKNLKTLYAMKDGVLRNYLQGFAFPRGVRIILGPLPIGVLGMQPELEDGQKRLADTLQFLLGYIPAGGGAAVNAVTIEKN